jgi:hypothetical protein
MSTKNTVPDLGIKTRTVLPALFDFYELVVYYVYLLASLLQSGACLSDWADQLGLCVSFPNIILSTDHLILAYRVAQSAAGVVRRQ